MERELPVPVLHLDNALRITAYNPVATEFVPELTAENGRSLASLLADLLQEQLAEGSGTLRFRARLRSRGRFRTYELSLSRSNESWVCVLHELRRDVCSFEFLEAMGHELRTPLTGVLGLSEALEMGLYGDCNREQQQAARKIHKSGERLLRRVNGILDIAKLEIDKAQIQKEQLEASGFLESVVELSLSLAEEKRVQLTLPAEPPRFRFHGDPTRLMSAVSYLTDEIIKSTLPGSTVSVGATLQGVDVVLAVRGQQGRGLVKTGGPGPKVRLAERLVELMGGVLDLADGDEFKVVLPGAGSDEGVS